MLITDGCGNLPQNFEQLSTITKQARRLEHDTHSHGD